MPKKLSLNKPRPLVKQELPLTHKSGRAFQATKKMNKALKICFPDTDANRLARNGTIGLRKSN